MFPSPASARVEFVQAFNDLWWNGDKVTVVFSGSEPGVGLVVKKPAGEPVVPSVIFSGWRID
jgi:hypothetical protein